MNHVPAKHIQKIDIGFYKLFDGDEEIGSVRKLPKAQWAVDALNGASTISRSGSRTKAIQLLLQIHRGWETK